MSDVSQMDVNRLQRVVDRLKKLAYRYRHAHGLQSTLYELSELSYNAADLNDFLAAAHKLVGQFLPASNLYIALKKGDHLVPIYFKDERDDLETLLKSSDSMDSGLSGYVIRTEQPLLCDEATYEQLQLQGMIEAIGAPPVNWLGVPLFLHDQVYGVLVVQSYDPEKRYQPQDSELLAFLARHIAIAMRRLDDRTHFEQCLKQRTEELLETNHALRQQVATTRAREQRLKTLYEIADEALHCLNLDQLLPKLHEIIQRHLHAPNMYIALLNESVGSLRFPYHCDERMPRLKSRPLSTGLTEYVLSTDKGLIADLSKREELMEKGLIYQDPFTLAFREYGEEYVWMGVPLKLGGRTVGVLALQIYDKRHHFKQEDLDWLTFVSGQVALAIERLKQGNGNSTSQPSNTARV